MKRFFLVPVLGLGLVGLAAPVHAQSGGWPNRPEYADEARQPYYQSRRIAYDNGYREGLKEGEKDGRRRDAFEFRDEGAWRNADKGFHRTYGDRERYRQTFRAGFEAGYSDAYRRYVPNYGPRVYGNGRAVPRRTPAPSPNYPPYPNRAPGGYYPGQPGSGYGYSPAYANGSRDGYEKGLEDARDRDSYDPLRHRWYRSGDRNYRSEYGSRERYRNEYRQGFQEGYDRGYRGGTYRR
jgi:flagellar biosynthesis/type III secretory pathway protein FliH